MKNGAVIRLVKNRCRREFWIFPDGSARMFHHFELLTPEQFSEYYKKLIAQGYKEI